MDRSSFVALLRAHGRGRARLPPQLHPVGIIADYRGAIVKGPLEEAIRLVREHLTPALERLAASASRIATTDARDDVGSILDGLRESHAKEWTRERYAKIIQPHAVDLEKFQAGQLNKQLRTLVTVDVVGSEPWLGPAITDFTRENVALIKTIPNVFFDDLEKHLTSEIADGVRWEEMATTIEDRYGVAANRAELIARDQAGKFFGDLNRVRQVDLGITGAVWRTMQDNRVRDEHVAREGVAFEWAEGIDGETPGEPVLCRCSGEPDVSELIED